MRIKNGIKTRKNIKVVSSINYKTMRTFFSKSDYRNVEILGHLMFWITYYFYPFIKFSDHNRFVFDYWGSFINTIIFVISVYTLHLSYFKRRKKGLAFLFSGIILLLFLYYNCVYHGMDCDCNIRVCYVNKTVEFLFINVLFWGIKAIRANVINQQNLQKSEQERVKAELEVLKAQINPHFLFNTLNMLYNSSLNKDEDLSDKILMLSDNLHYVLHEGKKNSVDLEQEIAFIRDYIALFESRFKDKIKVDLIYETDNPQTQIPPLLLIPFVENALKYTSMVEGKLLPLSIKVFLEEGILNFSTQNTFDGRRSEKIDAFKESGIGIKNVEKRLKLLFPNRYALRIFPEGTLFNVLLKIELT
jgi:two-component system, LytTR family, sensor kinase